MAVVGETLILTEDRGGGADRATACDAADGNERWQAKLPRVGRARVEPIGDGVLIIGAGVSGETGADVVALAIDDGAEWWRTRASTAQSLLVDDEPRILVGRDGGVELTDVRNGKVVPVDGDLAGAVEGGFRHQRDHRRRRRAGRLDGLRVVSATGPG